MPIAEVNVNFKFIVQDKIFSRSQIHQFGTNYISCHRVIYYCCWSYTIILNMNNSVFASPNLMMQPVRQKHLHRGRYLPQTVSPMLKMILFSIADRKSLYFTNTFYEAK